MDRHNGSASQRRRIGNREREQPLSLAVPRGIVEHVLDEAARESFTGCLWVFQYLCRVYTAAVLLQNPSLVYIR